MSEKSVWFVEYRPRGKRVQKWSLILGAPFRTKADATDHKRTCDECDGADDVHRVVEYRRVETPPTAPEKHE